jgi:hypothetical protein
MAQTSGVFSELSDQRRKLIYDFSKAGFDELESVAKKLFKKQSTTRKFERIQSVAGFGAMPAKSEGAEYSFDLIQPGYSKDITPVEYGFGFEHTETAQEDDDEDVLAQRSKLLGFSARVLQETLGANVFINGFSTQLTADGVALFHTAHTLKRGGTAKNELTTPADLSPTSLDQMRSDMRLNTKLESGQLVRPAKGFYLVHHPANEGLAIRICKSQGLQGTANNDMNHLRETMDLEPLPWEYLSDEDAFFLVAKKSSAHGLINLTRVGPKINAEMIDPKTGNRIITCRMRDVYDSFDWRNVAGTEGA